jgi:hypothetical protein
MSVSGRALDDVDVHLSQNIYEKCILLDIRRGNGELCELVYLFKLLMYACNVARRVLFICTNRPAHDGDWLLETTYVNMFRVVASAG